MTILYRVPKDTMTYLIKEIYSFEDPNRFCIKTLTKGFDPYKFAIHDEPKYGWGVIEDIPEFINYRIGYRIVLECFITQKETIYESSDLILPYRSQMLVTKEEPHPQKRKSLNIDYPISHLAINLPWPYKKKMSDVIWHYSFLFRFPHPRDYLALAVNWENVEIVYRNDYYQQRKMVNV